MPRMGRTFHARAVAWWRRCHADPEKRTFRRIGLVSFGVVGGSVLLAKVTQETPVAGVVRPLAITTFGLAALTLLVVVILMGEQVVEQMDASDPMRVHHGGAYGPRIKWFLRELGSQGRAWVTSLPARVVALRHDVTRESLARFSLAAVEALRGVPPPGVGPPRGAGRLGRMNAAPPPPPEPDAQAAQADEVASPSPKARRRALTASELQDRPTSAAPARSSRAGAAPRGTAVRASRRRRPIGTAASRTGRVSNAVRRSTR